MSDKKGMLELTARAVVLGLVLSVVMGAANVYLGLKAGMTVSASIPAAVVAMLILRGLFRTGTILEANQVQTAASAGESLAAGIIFTMPALILIGAWERFDVVLTTIIAFTGGLLGILFMIPMRRVFVVDNDELKFPEGVACAAVLEAGESADDKADLGHDVNDTASAMPVIVGGLVGVAFKALVSFAGVLKGTLEGATLMSNRIFFFGADISPALVAVGLIVRLNVSVLIFIGGGLGWLIGIPLLGAEGHAGDPLEGAWGLWSTKIRYVGVGAMVVGGIASIWRVRHGLVHAVQELSKRFKPSQAKEEDPHGRDLPSVVIVGLSLLATVFVFGTYWKLTSNIGITAVTTVIMLIMSFFFTAVASYIVGLVGNSNSPVSGMTITAVLFTGLLLMIFKFTGQEGMVATLGVAAIVCCAACTSGDVCNDLKTGSIVGAAPYRQQIMQVAGVAAASLVMAPILQLLHDNTPGGIGGRELSAPQAGLFASLAKGFFGDGQLPWDMVQIGAVIGVVILIIDAVLEKQKSTFRAHLMPIAVGMYLPFGLAVPILLGGVIAHLLAKGTTTEEAEDKALRRGVLFSSGIIAGESLTGVGIAILSAVGVSRLDLGLPGWLTTGLTWVFALSAVAMFYVYNRNKKAS
jgi:putative OPT family oligopeptide transporter